MGGGDQTEAPVVEKPSSKGVESFHGRWWMDVIRLWRYLVPGQMKTKQKKRLNEAVLGPRRVVTMCTSGHMALP
jgi:hypothetical protein